MKKIPQILFTLILTLTFCFSYSQTKTSLKQKAQMFLTKLKKQGDYPFIGKDTLIDLNNDNLADILIEYYGGSGTGLKNRVTDCIYSSAKKDFKECEQLSYLANPTFYPTKRIVAGYYIANGGGHATKLKWNGLKLDTLENIDVDITEQNNQLCFKLDTYNYITKKKSSKYLDIMSLPQVYRYIEYEPIIKRENP